MSATEYEIDLRDIRFVLHEQMRISESLKSIPRYAELDRDTLDSFLDECGRVALEVLARSNRDGDRIGCKLDADGNVTTPPGFKEAWKATTDGGWNALCADEQYGGMGMPQSLGAAVGEILTGANTAFATYPGLGRAAANLLAEYAPEPHRTLGCTKLFSGEWRHDVLDRGRRRQLCGRQPRQGRPPRRGRSLRDHRREDVHHRR
jgi:alkylation response protein AidB-like acyl-CoA dehydrogenase